jgi:superfamily II DNA or RNA helicase
VNKVKLYEWQKQCIDKWFSVNCRGIAQVATGGGKTFMAITAALKLIKKNPDLKIKIVVPKTFLVNQWKSCLIDEFAISKNDIGCYFGKEKCITSKLFMIYVINSARYNFARTILKEQKQGYSHLLILDECHHYSSQENSKIFEFLNKNNYNKKQYFSLGLSATPKTMTSNLTIEKFIGPIFYSYSISEAMKDKIINECILYNVKLEFTYEESKLYDKVSLQISQLIGILYCNFPSQNKLRINQDQFIILLKKLIRTGDEENSNLARSIIQKLYERQNILYNASSRLSAVESLVKLIPKNKKIIIFTERITQADAIFSILSKKYIGKVVRYHSKMDVAEKQFSLESYKNDYSNILITCKALDEGLNIPSSDIGIILSGNSQERQRIQRLGRILRKIKDKPQSSLFYCYIGRTVEKESLLTGLFDDSKNFNLVYNNISNIFSFPYYEKISKLLLDEIQSKNENVFSLFSTYLQEGTFKNDWLEPLAYIENRSANATNTDRKNYWYCMKRLSLIRLKIQK